MRPSKVIMYDFMWTNTPHSNDKPQFKLTSGEPKSCNLIGQNRSIMPNMTARDFTKCCAFSLNQQNVAARNSYEFLKIRNSRCWLSGDTIIEPVLCQKETGQVRKLNIMYRSHSSGYT